TRRSSDLIWRRRSLKVVDDGFGAGGRDRVHGSAIVRAAQERGAVQQSPDVGQVRTRHGAVRPASEGVDHMLGPGWGDRKDRALIEGGAAAVARRAVQQASDVRQFRERVYEIGRASW